MSETSTAQLPTVAIYSHGLVACSVCAPIALSIEEVEDATNRLIPTGISSRWSVSSDPTFASGSEQPGPCDQLPETHIHYLMEC